MEEEKSEATAPPPLDSFGSTGSSSQAIGICSNNIQSGNITIFAMNTMREDPKNISAAETTGQVASIATQEVKTALSEPMPPVHTGVTSLSQIVIGVQGIINNAPGGTITNIAGNSVTVQLPQPKEIIKEVRICDQPYEHFSGRDQEVKLLREKLEICTQSNSGGARTAAGIVVVTGPGGMGKSELVRKFCSNSKEYPHLCQNVAWIDASSKESVKESFERIGRSIGVCPVDRKTVLTLDELVKLVYKHFSDYIEGGLFVFDNAKQMKSERNETNNKPNFGIYNYLPLRGNYVKPPLVVVTSRYAAWGLPTIQLREMTEVESCTLMRAYFSVTDDQWKELEADVTAICNELHGYPLALALAASNIAHRNLRTTSIDDWRKSLKDYQAMLRRRRNGILETKFPSSEPTNYDDTLSVVLDDSVKQFLTLPNGTVALDLLCILSYLPSDNNAVALIDKIYQSYWLHRYRQLEESFTLEPTETVTGAIAELENLSLVTTGQPDLQEILKTVRIHELVQKYFRQYDEKQGNLRNFEKVLTFTEFGTRRFGFGAHLEDAIAEIESAESRKICLQKYLGTLIQAGGYLEPREAAFVLANVRGKLEAVIRDDDKIADLVEIVQLMISWLEEARVEDANKILNQVLEIGPCHPQNLHVQNAVLSVILALLRHPTFSSSIKFSKRHAVKLLECMQNFVEGKFADIRTEKSILIFLDLLTWLYPHRGLSKFYRVRSVVTSVDFFAGKYDCTQEEVMNVIYKAASSEPQVDGGIHPEVFSPTTLASLLVKVFDVIPAGCDLAEYSYWLEVFVVLEGGKFAHPEVPKVLMENDLLGRMRLQLERWIQEGDTPQLLNQSSCFFDSIACLAFHWGYAERFRSDDKFVKLLVERTAQIMRATDRIQMAEIWISWLALCHDLPDEDFIMMKENRIALRKLKKTKEDIIKSFAGAKCVYYKRFGQWRLRAEVIVYNLTKPGLGASTESHEISQILYDILNFCDNPLLLDLDMTTLEQMQISSMRSTLLNDVSRHLYYGMQSMDPELKDWLPCMDPDLLRRTLLEWAGLLSTAAVCIPPDEAFARESESSCKASIALRMLLHYILMTPEHDVLTRIGNLAELMFNHIVENGGDKHQVQVSQSHESCLNEFRRVRKKIEQDISGFKRIYRLIRFLLDLKANFLISEGHGNKVKAEITGIRLPDEAMKKLGANNLLLEELRKYVRSKYKMVEKEITDMVVDMRRSTGEFWSAKWHIRTVLTRLLWTTGSAAFSLTEFRNLKSVIMANAHSEKTRIDERRSAFTFFANLLEQPKVLRVKKTDLQHQLSSQIEKFYPLLVDLWELWRLGRLSNVPPAELFGLTNVLLIQWPAEVLCNLVNAGVLEAFMKWIQTSIPQRSTDEMRFAWHSVSLLIRPEPVLLANLQRFLQLNGTEFLIEYICHNPNPEPRAKDIFVAMATGVDEWRGVIKVDQCNKMADLIVSKCLPSSYTDSQLRALDLLRELLAKNSLLREDQASTRKLMRQLLRFTNSSECGSRRVSEEIWKFLLKDKGSVTATLGILFSTVDDFGYIMTALGRESTSQEVLTLILHFLQRNAHDFLDTNESAATHLTSLVTWAHSAICSADTSVTVKLNAILVIAKLRECGVTMRDSFMESLKLALAGSALRSLFVSNQNPSRQSQFSLLQLTCLAELPSLLETAGGSVAKCEFFREVLSGEGLQMLLNTLKGNTRNSSKHEAVLKTLRAWAPLSFTRTQNLNFELELLRILMDGLESGVESLEDAMVGLRELLAGGSSSLKFEVLSEYKLAETIHGFTQLRPRDSEDVCIIEAAKILTHVGYMDFTATRAALSALRSESVSMVWWGMRLFQALFEKSNYFWFQNVALFLLRNGPTVLWKSIRQFPEEPALGEAAEDLLSSCYLPALKDLVGGDAAMSEHDPTTLLVGVFNKIDVNQWRPGIAESCLIMTISIQIENAVEVFTLMVERTAFKDRVKFHDAGLTWKLVSFLTLRLLDTDYEQLVRVTWTLLCLVIGFNPLSIADFLREGGAELVVRTLVNFPAGCEARSRVEFLTMRAYQEKEIVDISLLPGTRIMDHLVADIEKAGETVSLSEWINTLPLVEALLLQPELMQYTAQTSLATALVTVLEHECARKDYEEVMIVEMWKFLVAITNDLPQNSIKFVEAGGLALIRNSWEMAKNNLWLQNYMLAVMSNVCEVPNLRVAVHLADLVPLVFARPFSSIRVDFIEASDKSDAEKGLIAVGINYAFNILAYLLSDGELGWKGSMATREALHDGFKMHILHFFSAVKMMSNYSHRSLKPLLYLTMVSHTCCCQMYAMHVLQLLLSCDPRKYVPMFVEEGGLEVFCTLKPANKLVRDEAGKVVELLNQNFKTSSFN